MRLGDETMRINQTARVPYSARQMFDLVADIEAYPQFLPWCSDARVLDRTQHEVTATIALSKGGIRQSFSTRNRHHAHERIDLQLVDGPFRSLHGYWRFEPVGENGTTSNVSLHLEFEFRNRLLAMTFGRAFHHIANAMVDAFCERARAVYG